MIMRDKTHSKFAESLREQVIKKEKPYHIPEIFIRNTYKDMNEEELQKKLEEAFDELFGATDDS